MSWSGAQRAFFVECLKKNGNSYVAAKREFKIRYNINYKKPVPSRNTIVRWVKKFRACGTTLTPKSAGRTRNVRTPENVAKVKSAVHQSPMRSARKHAPVLRVPEKLKARITQKIKEIPPTMLNRVMETFKKRLNECIANDGRHLSDTIFKS